MHHKVKERLAAMERRHLIAACAIVLLVAVGIIAGTVALVAHLQDTPTYGSSDTSRQ